MPHAQDQAFAELVTRRGLVDPRRLGELLDRPDGEPLAQALVREGLLRSARAAELLGVLGRGRFACGACERAWTFAELAGAPGLRCGGCGGLLELREPAAPGASGLHHSLVVEGPSAPAAGRRLGVYRLLEELGRGSNGAVFLAKREGLERPFALKVLLGAQLDEEGIERFKLEATIASRLDETGVVGVYDVGRAEGHYYYAMDYCPGITLEQRIARGPLPPLEAARVVAQVAASIHHAHEHHVLHRDLKPGNLILDERRGRPRITDFGLARDEGLARRLTRTGDVLGTPYYMAPEQISGHELDRRVDVYALGVILYECLAGRRPFEARTFVELAEEIRAGRAPALREVASDVPRELEDIVARAMARRREARFATARELADALETFVARPPPPPTSSAASAGRRLVVAAGVLLVVAGGVALGLAAARGGRAPAEGTAAPDGAPAPTPEPPTPTGSEPPAAGAAALLAEARALEERRAASAEVLAALGAAAAAADGEPLASEVALVRAEYLLARGRLDELLAAPEPGPRVAGTRACGLLRLRAAALEKLGREEEAAALHDRAAALGAAGVGGLLARAAAARLRRDAAACEAAAKRALELDPGSVEALLELAMLAIRTDRDEAAADQLLARALALEPDNPRVRFGRALLMARLGNEAAALDELDRAVTLLEPDPDPQALLYRGSFRLETGYFERAVADLDRVLARRPHDVQALVLRGIARWRLTDAAGDRTLPDAAVEDWRRALEVDREGFRRAVEEMPDPRMRRHVLKGVGMGPGPLLQAAPALRTRLRDRAAAAGAGAEALFEALLGAAEGLPWDELAEAFARAGDAAPESPAVALERARVLVGRDVYDPALRAIQEARALGADPLELDRLQGEVWWHKGKGHVAVRFWEGVAQRDPEGVEGLCARSRAAAARGRIEEAQAAAAAALALDPDHGASLMARASALPPETERAEERALLERIIEVQGAIDAHVLLMREVATFARLVDPRDPSKAAPRLPPVFARIERTFQVSEGVTGRLLATRLALVSGQKRWRRRARAWLREARLLEPDRGDVHMHYGLVLLVSGGDREEILASWRRAKQVEPRIQLPSEWRDIFGQRFGATSELDALGLPLDESKPR